MSEEDLIANGIDGHTGQYLLPPLTCRQVAELAHRSEIDVPPAVPRAPLTDPRDLAASGWGVVFTNDADPAIEEALGELLEHRRRQAASKQETGFRIFSEERGYKTGQSAREFLAERGVGPGPVDPKKGIPYYLLIVGGPETIPFEFQFHLGLNFAVGRLHFESVDEYARYARSVVEAETAGSDRPRQVAFFGPENPHDRATRRSARQLIKPLASNLRQADWQMRTLVESRATKNRLLALLGGEETPALLFTATHGMGFGPGSARQKRHQGSLLCQDWLGPRAWRHRVPESFYVSADDIDDTAQLHGLVAFHFACHGAGTPRIDDFRHRGLLKKSRLERLWPLRRWHHRRQRPGTVIAPQPFVARLPQRLLAHPRGGALAVIGHVDRAWTYSFFWPNAGSQVQAFEGTVKRLMDGYPVGAALEMMVQRYADLAVQLSCELGRRKLGDPADDDALSRLWTAHNDARSYVLLGDPAVRLQVGDPPTEGNPGHA